VELGELVGVADPATRAVLAAGAGIASFGRHELATGVASAVACRASYSSTHVAGPIALGLSSSAVAVRLRRLSCWAAH